VVKLLPVSYSIALPAKVQELPQVSPIVANGMG